MTDEVWTISSASNWQGNDLSFYYNTWLVTSIERRASGWYELRLVNDSSVRVPGTDDVVAVKKRRFRKVPQRRGYGGPKK